MKVRVDTKPLGGPLPGGREGATVAVEPILTGTMACPRTFLEAASRLPRLRMFAGTPRSKWLRIPIPAFLIHHPGAGPFLVDTGLHASVASKPVENLGRLMGGGRADPVIEPGEDLPAQLRARGVDPKSLKLVVMTHMHFDHTSGMSQFPGAMFLITEAEWRAATEEPRPALHGYRHAHFDYAFDYRTIDYSEGVSSYASFGRTFDLFGDGSVRLASTPGHSAGHQSVICRLRDRDLVIAGDAIYTIGQLDDAPEPPRPEDRHTWQRSMRELRQFTRTYPQAVIIPGHDPDHWKTLEKRYE